VSVSIPERRYDLIAEILAEAVAGAPDDADGAARQVARATGRRMGGEWAGARAADVVAALDGLGYRPEADADGRVALNNCPFQALAARHTSLVCGLNHTFVTGLLEGLEATGVHARTAPRVGACCVEVTPG
jgi:predicted ArsR family transcriptional regulator